MKTGLFRRSMLDKKLSADQAVALGAHGEDRIMMNGMTLLLGPILGLFLLGCTAEPTTKSQLTGSDQRIPSDQTANILPPLPEIISPANGQDPEAGAHEDTEPTMPMSEPPAETPRVEPETPMCDDGINKPLPNGVAKIFFGTDTPTHVTLSPGQIKAVGDFNGCSGLLIAPTWVLTAAHCQLSSRAQFCIGDQPDDANICIRGRRTINHPSGDIALVELEGALTVLAPDVIPIPIFTDSLDNSWIGQTAEAAGYGQDENGRMGRREFVAEPIVALYGDAVTVDGEGEHGVCFGDSGGPLMVIASDGSTRVIGALSNGDGSCVGRDNYTRVDTYLDWIEGYTGPTQAPGPQGCGDITSEGSCQDGTKGVAYCSTTDELVNEVCENEQHCAWSSGDRGWRCLPSETDPCRGVTYQGTCTNGVLTWCDKGVVQRRHCHDCGEVCGQYDAKVGFRCLENQCEGMPVGGRCDGDVAVWCDGAGRIERRDCRARGQRCAFVDEEIGYFCTGSGRCDGLSYEGTCDGQVAIWCDEDGNPKSMECSRTDRQCRFVNDNVGYYCTDCGDVSFQGRCDGDTAVWCNRRGQLEARDCAAQSESCRFINDESGFFCSSN